MSDCIPGRETVCPECDRVTILTAQRDEARAEVERRDALIRSDGYEDMRQHAADLAAELATARAEVERLQAELGTQDADLHITRCQLAVARQHIEALVGVIDMSNQMPLVGLIDMSQMSGSYIESMNLDAARAWLKGGGK